MFIMTIYFIFLFYLLFRFVCYLLSGTCRCKGRMDNKTVIITGAHKGVGYEAARDLANRGARVIIACRDPAKGALARDQIIVETMNNEVDVKYLDLSSFDCIRNFAIDVLRTENQLHVLVNNVAVGKLDNSLTEDNLPVEVQVNYLGPFLLTMLLLPLLRKSKPSRIVNASSVMHWVGRIEFDKFTRRARTFVQHSRVYANTKLANLLFTNKLSQKLRASGVTANSFYAGIITTDVMKDPNVVLGFIIRLFFKSPRQGAQTVIHLCVAPELTHVSGKYFVDCKVAWQSRYALDQQVADRLWMFTEKLCAPTDRRD